MSNFMRECSHKTMTFEDIRACINANRTDVLGRSESGQMRYIDAMMSVKARYANVSDYILITKFGFAEIARTGDNKLRAHLPNDVHGHEELRQLVWTVNDFPYNFASDVKSYIIWKLGEGDVKIIQEEIDIALEDIKKQLGTLYKEHVCFESAPNLKSIPDLAHIHLLVQTRSRYEDVILRQYKDLDLAPTLDGFRHASKLLNNGQLVAFPTETVYGLGANALNSEAVLSIFRAKGRPLTDPLIVHVSSASDALPLINLTADTKEIFEGLGAKFWPGPLTIIVLASAIVPPSVTANTGSVGIRVPSHSVARRLLEESDVPIAAPSANRFGHVSPTTCAHVLADLGPKGVHCLNGESGNEITSSSGNTTLSCHHGIESTVIKIDSSTRRIMLFRQGAITKHQLEVALHEVDLRKSESDRWIIEVVKRTVEMHNTNTSMEKGEDKIGIGRDTLQFRQSDGSIAEGQEAPGQAITHYAPDVPCIVVKSVHSQSNSDYESEFIYKEDDSLEMSFEELHQHTVILDFNCSFINSLVTIGYGADEPFLAYWDLSSRGDYAEAARNLFAALRWAEIQHSARHILISTISPTNTVPPEKPTTSDIGETPGSDLKDGFEDRVFRATSGISVHLKIA